MTEIFPVLRVRAERVKPLVAGHPWIFSGAVLDAPRRKAGALVNVEDEHGRFIAVGTYHPANTIRVRVLSREPVASVDAAFFAARFAALRATKLRLLGDRTDAYRLANADADDLPGLIVDIYADTAVFQIHTAGMEILRREIVDALAAQSWIGDVVERSDVESRRQEGLAPREALLAHGCREAPLRIREDGLRYEVDVMRGQKTGFFLDQRDSRRLVRELAAGRSMLNLFSYTCAFGAAAAAGGAKNTCNVDTSSAALETGQRNYRLNGLAESEPQAAFLHADVFDYLRSPNGGFDLIVCDPPAFAKSRDSLEDARKAYIRLNRRCFELLPEHSGLLVTCSCSGMVTDEEFRALVRVAAGQAGRRARLIAAPSQAADHTQNLAFPEGRYLKVLVVETGT